MSATGRPPRKRDSYFADAQSLMLLIRAIEADASLDTDWSVKTMGLLRDAARELINAPQSESSEIKAAQARKARDQAANSAKALHRFAPKKAAKP